MVIWTILGGCSLQPPPLPRLVYAYAPGRGQWAGAGILYKIVVFYAYIFTQFKGN